MFQKVTLDVTDSKKLGRELVDEIYQRVKETQKYIMTTLPNELVITTDQFDTINNGDSNKKGRLFHTPMNVMDVKVVE